MAIEELGRSRKKVKDKKKRKVSPLRAHSRKQNEPVGMNGTIRGACKRMVDNQLTHDQVVAAEKRATVRVGGELL